MRTFLRKLQLDAKDTAVPLLVAMTFCVVVATVVIVVGRKLEQVVTDIHTIAESVEKSD